LKIAEHIRSNIVGFIAVFIALTGTAWAVQNDSVRSRHIKDGQVKTPDLAGDAVTNPKVADDAIGSAEVIANSLTGADVQEGSLAEVPSATAADSAANADLLDNLNSTAFLGANAKAADAELLDGFNSTAFLGFNAKAADSNMLDGLDSSAFVQTQGATFIDAGLVEGCVGADSYSNTNVGNENIASYYRDFEGIVHLRGHVYNCAPAGPILSLPQGFRPGFDEYHLVYATGSSQPYTEVALDNSGPVVGSLLGTGATLYLDGITFRCGPAGVAGCP
jgi:hypothetical protein